MTEWVDADGHRVFPMFIGGTIGTDAWKRQRGVYGWCCRVKGMFAGARSLAQEIAFEAD